MEPFVLLPSHADGDSLKRSIHKLVNDGIKEPRLFHYGNMIGHGFVVIAQD